MEHEPSDRQVCRLIERQDWHEPLFVWNGRQFGSDEGSAMEEIEKAAFLVNRDAFNCTRESNAEVFIAISHELNSFADCKWNAGECVQSARQLGQGGEVCLCKPTNGIGQCSGGKRPQR